MTDATDSKVIPTAHVTDDREAYPEVWVAALVQTNCERSVAEKIHNLSITCFVASQEEVHRWSDRLKKVQRLVIPNIVFVKTSKDRFDELKRYSFIRGLMTYPGRREPAVIPDSQMQNLQFMLGHSENPVLIDADSGKFKLGKQVRIIRGSLRGIEGTVCRLSDGSLHVGLQIASLGFAHVNISASDIQEI